MYRLDVEKLPNSSSYYSVCLSRDGHPVEDYVCITSEQAGYLVDEGYRLVRGEDDQIIPSNLDITIGRSNKSSNSYQFIVKVSDTYLKVFILTEVEMKLFIASLKRAIDG